jgi:hypothetical protein
VRHRIALFLALLVPLAAEGEERRRAAVLEYRGGVDKAPDLAAALADRLKKTAALEVFDLAEVRRRNPRVDAEIAKCAGDVECTARAGVKLSVDEVLLVAMSQLGDLVVNIQRIDSVTGKVTGAPLSAVLSASRAVDEAQIDAWLHQLYGPEVFKRYGYISVIANVEGAVVTINGKVMGETPLDGKLRVLAPRNYKVSLTKKDRVPFTARLDVVPDATQEVRAEMPEATQKTPWYKRWYPWAIVGGAVAAGAVSVLVWKLQPITSSSDAILNSTTDQ